MSKYHISCDLLANSENYDQLLDELTVLNAVRVLETTWVVNSDLSVEQIGRRIAPHVERIFITESTGLASWLNPLSSVESVKATLR